MPEYLLDIKLSQEIGVLTRNYITKDTDLIPQNGNFAENDDFDLDEILNDVTVQNIQNLHDNRAFTDENITLRDLPRLLAQQGGGEGNDELLDEGVLDEEDVGDGVTGQDQDPVQKLEPALPDGINDNNILPHRLRRTVRFNLPKS